MRALVLAAGLGERMRPLTNTTPKPLLEAGGKPLIAWHLERFAAIGVTDVVVNTSWLASEFPKVLGDGSREDDGCRATPGPASSEDSRGASEANSAKDPSTKDVKVCGGERVWGGLRGAGGRGQGT